MRVEWAEIHNETTGKVIRVWVPENFLRKDDLVRVCLVANSAHDEPWIKIADPLAQEDRT